MLQRRRNKIAAPHLANKSTNNESKVYLKDILIPLFTASLAVGFNQLFFTSNKKAEAMIDFRKERIKQELPVLNRIFAFTSIFAMTETGLTRDTLYIRKTKDGYTDTTYLNTVSPRPIHKAYTYAFVTDTSYRKKFEADLNFISQNRDLLPPNVYLQFERILFFIQTKKLPNLDNLRNLVNSVWFEESVKTDWRNLIHELQFEAFEESKEFLQYKEFVGSDSIN